jgi:hypothetical protein
MTRKSPGTWTLWSQNQSKPYKMSSTSFLWQSGRFPKNWPACRKPVSIAHENRPKRTFSRKNKIRNRLARKPTLVVLCHKLCSVRGEGTVGVTKCVILASVWASKFLLRKLTKWPVKVLERGPYGPKINRNLIKCHLQVFLWQSGRFPKNWPGCRKPCAIAHENRPKRTFSRKNKIRNRLARKPTLVVLCLKLWSVRGEGSVGVTKCVILASVWASKFLLGKLTKWPVKGLERGPYGPKINRNLIKSHLQVFCDNPGGFKKIGPGAENRVL